MKSKQLIILGFGGHARSVADIALNVGYKKLLFIDENAKPDESFLGHPVSSNLDAIDLTEWGFFIAAGDNYKRAQQFLFISELKQNVVSLIAPSSYIGVGAQLGMGCLVGHHAHVGPMAVIGNGVILNTSSIVEHESKVGAFAHVSINAAMAGRSSLGDFSMLGAGATIIDGVSVPNDSIIGAGAIVHRSINTSGTYVGIPARLIVYNH